MERRSFFLVYQGGIANVFEVDCLNLADFWRNAKRLRQTDFRSAALFAQGLVTGGHIVKTAACNQAGDITHLQWYDKLSDMPFSDDFIIVNSDLERAP